MVTVYRTITESTNGRREKPDGSGWQRRVGVERIPNPKDHRRPIQRTIWEDCPAPERVLYGSPEHQAKREMGKGGGTVETHIEGIETDDDLPVTLNAVEMEMLLRYYAAEFGGRMRAMQGTIVIGQREQETPAQHMLAARAAADRAKFLFGVDLWETNLVHG